MDNLNTVAFEASTPINLWGISGNDVNRLMAVYRTTGCSYGKGKACTMCNFALYANDDINETNIMRQHKQILSQLKRPGYQQFDLLTLGNFFNDNEVSPNLRVNLLTPLSKMEKLKRVLVESRYSYMSKKKLLDAKNCLNESQELELAFGYEAVTEGVRNGVLRKGVKEEHLDKVLGLCEKAGIDFVSYVMIKPHTLSEYEGINEAVKTALHVLRKAKKYSLKARIAFEPVFVVEGKEIENYYLRGEYTPPRLWSIIEVLRRTIDGLGSDFREGSLFVGMSDENLSHGRTSANCGDCDEGIIEAIQHFNSSQNINSLLDLSCGCKKDWESLISNPSLPDKGKQSI